MMMSKKKILITLAWNLVMSDGFIIAVKMAMGI
jgi:hypothetical protein